MAIRSSTHWYYYLVVVAFLVAATAAFQPAKTTNAAKRSVTLFLSSTAASSSSSPAWFSGSATREVTATSNDETSSSSPSAVQLSLEQLKAQILQLGAALDRGQAYNPTSGSYYCDTMQVAKTKVQQLVEQHPKPATSLSDVEGEWELVLTTVAHGIFRSSPFFLAIQEAYERYAEEKESLGEPKANLFFRLHELQTCSWGVSKIGRVAQTIRPSNDDNNQYYLYSEFDTSIFSLTVIPILGFWKLLPTFGGCVITAAKCQPMTSDDGPGVLKMEVDYTTSRRVPGLSGLPLIGDAIWKVRVPVGAIWKLLPWNRGRPASCQVTVRYVDNDFRVVEDVCGDFFVYTRPVVARPLDDDV